MQSPGLAQASPRLTNDIDGASITPDIAAPQLGEHSQAALGSRLVVVLGTPRAGAQSSASV